MRKIQVIGISILSVFILCSLSYQPLNADTLIEETHLRFYFGEAHNCYIGEDYSEFQTYNMIEVRYWRNDTDWGLKFLHHKGSYTCGFGSGWKFYGIMEEGFICGFFYVWIEL